jgi:hydroxyacylglutathione hydrolase
VLLRQFVDEGLGCCSYLVGNPDAGEAVVVDPAFSIEQYLDAAERDGVQITRVLETHTHADHLSGHGRFALEHRIPESIHGAARPEYEFEPLTDGQVLEIGAVAVRVMHTPGHRPEHCAFVVDEDAVLTGDSLFVGDAARPDLAIDAREGATDLFHSLRRLAELPDAVVVYPGHVAGSLCGSHMSPDHSSSVHREKETNHALELADVGAFVEEMAAVTTPRPPTTERLVALNRGPWVSARPPLEPISTVGAATVLDVRPLDAFAAGHLPGAISVALDGGSFATRAAFVLDPDEPVVIHAGSASEAQTAAQALWSVGLFAELGYTVEAETPATMPTVTVPELARLVEQGVQVVDVREDDERTAVLPGSIGMPYRLVRTTDPDELDPGRPVYTVCESGQRATLAASVLAGRGYDARPLVGGGVDDVLDAARG